jgi:hypothetical protein
VNGYDDDDDLREILWLLICIYFPPVMCNNVGLSIMNIVVLGGVMVIVLPIGPKVRWFKPERG